MGRRAALHNLGCRVNAYETEAMTELLKKAGYEIVSFQEKADVYVVNTCTVTNIADRKSRQMLHRARELNPDAVVVAAGCYAEDGKERLAEDAAVDLILGNSEKALLTTRLDSFFREKEADACTCVQSPPELAISSVEGKARAFLKIQDGCNQFCTYCIIPFVRGRVRSRSAEEVLSEVRALAARGFTEVTLSGIHISSYGLDFSGKRADTVTPDAGEAHTNRALLDLIRETAAVPGILRVRLGSLEPGLMTEEFAEELASLPEVCPHFHISLQSGCDATLKRMHRRYVSADYRRIVERLRGCFADPGITTDVIAGFPGETEEEFRTSLAFVRDMQFAGTHVFKYSRRQGTKAAEMPDQIPESVKRERSRLYMELDREAGRAFAERFVGKEEEVLFEEVCTRAGRQVSVGRTRRYMEAFSEILVPPGSVRRCRILSVEADGSAAVMPVS